MQRLNSPVRVELVYDRDCPNVDRARSMIHAALGRVGAEATWIEWDREDSQTPADLRSYGSPTVLVNGQDVGCDGNEAAQSDANSCRVYVDDCGCGCGTRSTDLIVSAIRGAKAA
jgi:mercuric ion transport protein